LPTRVTQGDPGRRRYRCATELLHRLRRYPGLLVVCVLTAALSAAYGVFLPNLIDRDEASFFSTVHWYATHASMPVLGHAGVSYEAQQGPLYFVPAAVIDRVLQPMGAEVAFHAVRALGIPLLVVIVVLAYLLAARLCPDNRAVPLLTAVFVGLNPHLLALGGSVSNDLLGIAIAMSAVYVFVRSLQSGSLGGTSAIGVGLLIGLSIITKPSALSLLVALPLAVFAVRTSRPMAATWLIIAGSAAASGWWFVRNEVIYGDLTGINGLRRWGWPVHPGSLDSIRAIGNRVSYFAVSYASPQPTFGGSFRTPLLAKVVFAAIALGATAGLARQWRRRSPSTIHVDRAARVTFGLVLVTSIGANLYSYITVLVVDPRTTFASFFVVACAASVGLAAVAARFPRTMTIALVAAALLAADVVTLAATTGIERPPLQSVVQAAQTPR
jgi:hypothetical protein